MAEENMPLEEFDKENQEDEANETSLEASGEVTEISEEARLAAVHRIPVTVRCVVGSTKLPVSQVLQFNRGSVIELDKKIGEPVDILVNDRLVARGDLVVVEGKRLGVTLTEIVKDPNLSE